MIDMEYDSRSNHGPAIIALADGWNSFREPHVCDWNPEHRTPTHVFIDPYPKAQWYLSAETHLLFCDIDASKAMNVLLLILAGIVS